MNKLKNFLSMLVHKFWVFFYMSKICCVLMLRAFRHDASKFTKHEEPYFRKYATRLGKSKYGSKEYEGHKQSIKIALRHHYENNQHHPEFYEDGYAGMSMLDKLEMLADWQSSTKRNGGDIFESIEIGQKRFGYSETEKQLLIRTIKEFNKG